MLFIFSFLSFFSLERFARTCNLFFPLFMFFIAVVSAGDRSHFCMCGKKKAIE